jgi:predicted amino acid dehydrogenase
MASFAFIVHPLEPKADVARKYPLLARLMPTAAIHALSRYWPPLILSRVRGVRSSATGHQVEGWLLACPLTARQMLQLPRQVVYRKIVQTGRLAEKLGAQILGLGAYTSVGDGGLTVAQALDVPVTTGGSYTAALAVRPLLEAGRRAGVAPWEAVVAVVGATGAIGSVCARLLAPQVGSLILVGRQPERLERVRQQAAQLTTRAVQTATDLNELRRADLVLSATSAGQSLIRSEHLKVGAVVCDVARPRDVAASVSQERGDVLVLDGGLAETPGQVDFGFDYGLPPGLTFGCMAETIALALEGRFEDYTLGRDIEVERVQEIERIAGRHGLRPAGLFSFARPVTPEQVRAIRLRAAQLTGFSPV